MSSPIQHSDTRSYFNQASDWLETHQVVVPLVLYFALLALYLAFPTKNYYWDGISFAQTIEDTQELGTRLVHPNHLIYNVVGYYFYQVLLAIGFNVRAVTALQVLDSVVSALSAVVCFSILRTTIRSHYLSTFLTLLFALSATWWKFSTDADAYIISVFFLLCSFYFALPDRNPSPYLVAVLFTLSMCFHELAILFGPVLIVGIWFQEAKVESRRGVLTVLKFGGLTFVLTTTAYFSCFYFASEKTDLAAFARWLTYYSPDASFTFSFIDNLRYTLRGHVRLFFSGRFNLLKGLINFPTVLLFIALLASFGAFVVFTFKNFRKPGIKLFRAVWQNNRRRPLLIMSIVWIVTYVVFLFFWLPYNTFYRLFYVAGLVFVVGLLASARYEFAAYKPTFRLASFTAMLALANFLFLIFPYSHADKFPPTGFALQLSNEWKEGTVIYYGVDNSDKSLVRYFAPNTEWRELTNPLPDTINDELKYVYGGGSTVWLETTAIDRIASTQAGVEWLKTHIKTDSRRELNDQGFRIEFVQVVPFVR